MTLASRVFRLKLVPRQALLVCALLCLFLAPSVALLLAFGAPAFAIVAFTIRSVVRNLLTPDRRWPTVAAGAFVTLLILGDLRFGHDIALVAFPGFLAGYATLTALRLDGMVFPSVGVFMAVYWVVNTALLAFLLDRSRRAFRSVSL